MTMLVEVTAPVTTIVELSATELLVQTIETVQVLELGIAGPQGVPGPEGPEGPAGSGGGSFEDVARWWVD